MASPEGFRAEVARMRRDRDRAEASLRSAFEVSPAILVTEGSREELWILSPEVDPEQGKFRVTYFMDDGPRGHFSGTSMEDLVKELSSTHATHEPVDEAFVIQWTSTPKYQEGLRRVAFVQADNQLRWVAGQHGKAAYAWSSEIRDRAYLSDDVEEATAMLERAAADLKAGRAPNVRTLKARLMNAW